MPKYYFHVVGIRHHDFAGRLDELYAKAQGKSMTLCLEEENIMEQNAVRVNMVSEFVGYVRSGQERELAEELVRNERLSVIGHVVEIDCENRMLTLEVDTDLVPKRKGKERADKLKNWNYKGELLRQADEEITLKDVINNLQMFVEQQTTDAEKLKKYLDFIEKNLWRDAGIETQRQLEEIIKLFTANSDVVKGYEAAAKRLLFIATDVNSPEKRQRQVNHLYRLAKSDQVRYMIDEIGEEKVKAIINDFPKFLVKLFNNNPQEYVGRLWYMSCKYKKLRQLQTVMAMRIAMMNMIPISEIAIDDVLNGGKKTFENLSFAIENCYNGSNKNLALIYCVLRDNDLLVDINNYRKFVELLVYKNLLFWMDENEIKRLAYSIGQYMRDRMDHNKLRKGFANSYSEWDECKEKWICEEIAAYFKE